jgi:predicted nucleic acid-binding protein
LSIDLRGAVRRRKPEKRRQQLNQRPIADLVSAADFGTRARPVFVPDTNVYILDAAGELPSEASDLIDRGRMFHCSVCLGELSVGVANSDPAHPDWADRRDHYADLFASIQASRVLVPDAETWVEAGIVAGILSRVQGFQAHQKKECLNDALIFLTAAKAGLPVLTENRADFDLLQQITPEGKFVHF